MKLFKACYNENCTAYKKEIKYPEDHVFCPLCTHELSYVCSHKNCHNKLTHVLKRYCDECLSETANKKAKRAESWKNAPQILTGVGAAVGTVAAATPHVVKISKDVKKMLPKK